MITTSSLAALSFASLVNVINGNAHIILGGGIAFAINRLAHHIFKIHISYPIKAVAFLAGAGASFYVAPHAAIFAFTMNEALILGLGFMYIGYVSRIGNKNLLLVAELTLLSMIGLEGRVALIGLGTAAAMAGAFA